jgi:predicted NBD/HSP70 family sugar kinase
VRVDPKQRSVVCAVWRAGRLSRSQLAGAAGLTPNGAGIVADALVRAGILRECPPEPVAGAGRPRVPLEIDRSTKHVVGLAINPGGVEVVRVGLGGGLASKPAQRPVEDPAELVAAAAELLAGAVTRQTLGVGVSVTGFVDPADRAILFSSSLGRTLGSAAGRVSLAPVFAAAGACPVTLENDMHALAARWLFGRRADWGGQDVLLASVADGRVGAALLIDGRPNRGCVTAANELGHTRLFLDTARCYCGHVGCLERVATSDYLGRLDRAAGGNGRAVSLARRVAHYGGTVAADGPLETLLDHLTCGIANAVNFVRPHRLVVVDGLAGPPPFAAAVVRGTRRWLLPELAERVAIDVVTDPAVGSAESAAWLAIADLLDGGWNRVDGPPVAAVPGRRRAAVPA